MKSLVAAIQFITLLPAGREKVYDPVGMIAWFPVVGLLLGVLVSITDYLAGWIWGPETCALIAVLVLALLSGALHLDGLGDSADGLLGHHSPSRSLAIMKDSRVGMMGLVAVTACLAIKWAGLAGIDAQRSLTLVVVPALARGTMVFGVAALPYGRPGGGTGKGLFDRPLGAGAFVWLLLPAGLALFLGWRGVLLLTAAAVWTLLVLLYYQKRLGCITGDMLGAMTETSEALLFLLAAAGNVP